MIDLKRLAALWGWEPAAPRKGYDPFKHSLPTSPAGEATDEKPSLLKNYRKRELAIGNHPIKKPNQQGLTCEYGHWSYTQGCFACIGLRTLVGWERW